MALSVRKTMNQFVRLAMSVALPASAPARRPGRGCFAATHSGAVSHIIVLDFDGKFLGVGAGGAVGRPEPLFCRGNSRTLRQRLANGCRRLDAEFDSGIRHEPQYRRVARIEAIGDLRL